MRLDIYQRHVCKTQRLNSIFSPRIEHQNFVSPSMKKIEIITIASNYHIEVNPSDVGIYDRVVIQELIKTVASSNQLNKEGQREFKVLIMI